MSLYSLLELVIVSLLNCRSMTFVNLSELSAQLFPLGLFCFVFFLFCQVVFIRVIVEV